MTDYSKKFNNSAFWQKVKKFAKAAGKEVIEKALVLYYCLRDPDTPKFAKTVIVGALGYFIVPLDAIPDFTPIVGYADDLGSLVAALAMVAVHVKAEHRAKTEEKLREWFG